MTGAAMKNPSAKSPSVRSRALACLALALAACGPISAAVAQQPPEPFILGVCSHLAQHVPYPAATLDIAAQAGIRSIRDEAYWTAIEGEKGRFAVPAKYDDYVQGAVSRGMAPLLILDYGNELYDHGDKPRSAEAIAAFTAYAEFLARHFRGAVHSYEVWNEWDNGGGHTTPGTIDDYAPLLKSVYPALKAVDPEITVLADAVLMGHERDSDFEKLEQLGLLRFADGISVHPYKKTPEEVAEWLQRTEAALNRHNGGKEVPLYATEIGWATYKDGVGLTRSAAYAARLLLLARTMPFLRGVWWYNLRNDEEDPNRDYPNYGLIWTDLTPKPAYDAVADLAAALAGTSFVERLATADDQDWVLRFRTADGQDLWALWTAKDGALARVTLATLTAHPAPVRAAMAGRRPVDRSWVADPRGRGISRLDVTVGETPVLLRGMLGAVTLDQVTHLPFPSDRR